MKTPFWIGAAAAAYQVGSVIFFFQGLSIPLVILTAWLIWYPQHRRMKALERHLGPEDETEDPTLDAILKGLPKLQPLNCPSCGGGVLLEEHDTFCPHCQKHEKLPKDYAALAPLRRYLQKLTKRALWYWRVDRVLTLRFTEWIFKLLIVGELLLFPAMLVGSHFFPEKTWIDRYLDSLWLDDGKMLGISLAAFFGIIVWILLFYFLGWMSRELRKELPKVPTLPPSCAGAEVVNCQDCGGAIAYAAGAFAAICPYCHVVNLRAQLIRRERALGMQRQNKAKSILFGAMEIFDDFIGSFVFMSAIVVLVCLLVVAYQGCENYLHKVIPQF